MRAERFFSNLVAATGMRNPEALGSAWISALVGYVVRQAMQARPVPALLELTELLEVDLVPPDADGHEPGANGASFGELLARRDDEGARGAARAQL